MSFLTIQALKSLKECTDATTAAQKEKANLEFFLLSASRQLQRLDETSDEVDSKLIQLTTDLAAQQLKFDSASGHDKKVEGLKLAKLDYQFKDYDLRDEKYSPVTATAKELDVVMYQAQLEVVNEYITAITTHATTITA